MLQNPIVPAWITGMAFLDSWTEEVSVLFIQKSAKMSVVKKTIRRVKRISKFVPYALEIDKCDPKSYE